MRGRHILNSFVNERPPFLHSPSTPKSPTRCQSGGASAVVDAGASARGMCTSLSSSSVLRGLLLISFSCSTWIGGIRCIPSIDEGAAILSCTNAFISAVRKIRLEVEWGSEVLVVAAAAVAVKGWSAGNNVSMRVPRVGLVC